MPPPMDSEQPLIQKLKAEGETSSADMLLTVDAGNLWYAADQGVLRPTFSDVLEANIPAHLRDPEDQWFAMSVRARTIVYDTRAVDPAELSGYAGLADETFFVFPVLQYSHEGLHQILGHRVVRSS